MAIPRPSSWTKWLFRKTILHDIVIALLAAGVGLLGAGKYFQDGQHLVGTLISVLVVLIMGITVWKQVNTWRDNLRNESPHDLAGCLHALLGVLLAGQEPGSPSPKLRVTIHVPHSPGFLIQLLNYVGDQRQKNTGGRKFPSHCGIIGKAFQGGTGEDMIVGSRKNVNYTNYINELVNQWHYPEELARKLDAETMSWVAMPLNLNGRVEGILYLDAIKKDFFTESRKTLILGAAAGIAGYVAQRYN